MSSEKQQQVEREDDGGEEVQQEELKGDKAQEAKQLDSLTDVVEEKGDVGDSEKAKAALLSFAADDAAYTASVEAKERQLAAIKVKPEDVKLLMKELECSEMEAELKLKEKNNDIQQVIRDFITA